MAIDVYAPCPCGSGQKFKWCCQPIYQDIERAFEQETQGQHDTALRIMEELTVKHPTNPEVWGRKAQLLYTLDKVEESENALQRAFELNPNYPFGHLLRGMFRQNEGEIAGALILFRRAADLYDPGARDVLGQIYSSITECELKMHRPVAARAALQLAIHNVPADEDLRKAMETVFGPKSQLPSLARQDYTLRPPGGGSGSEAQTAWDKVVRDREKIRLSDLAAVFDQITRERPTDAAAWFNLGLARAWLGENGRAVEALDAHVQREADEETAASAWALAGVLSCAPGMEERSDYVHHSVLLEVRDPKGIMPMLEHFAKEQRLLLFQTEQEQQIISGMIMEKPQLLAGNAAHALPLQAYLLVAGNAVRIWHTNKDAVARLRQELQFLFPNVFGLGVQEFDHCANFSDVIAEAVVFPVGPLPDAELKKRLDERMGHFFEETWIQRPLRALDQVAPTNATADATLRKKLKGVIRFVEDCAALMVNDYDFVRLRRKLGLETAAAANGSWPREISSLGASELAALEPADLADAQLEQAYRTALSLDVEETAAKFARGLVNRPAAGDRFPVYSFLIQVATRDGRLDEALDWLEQGEKSDCEQNEGKRRNDYELRRAQLHVKRKEADQARDVFERLIDRVPFDMRVRAAAVEGMLSLRQGAHAAKMAEQALAKARELHDPESERHFLELSEAVRKLA
jgi:tetratricopeptide (TPR) repeat protein